MNTGSPSTMFVICLCEPVRDIKRPPNDAYAVLWEGKSGTAMWSRRIRRPLTQPPLNHRRIYTPAKTRVTSALCTPWSIIHGQGMMHGRDTRCSDGRKGERYTPRKDTFCLVSERGWPNDFLQPETRPKGNLARRIFAHWHAFCPVQIAGIPAVMSLEEEGTGGEREDGRTEL